MMERKFHGHNTRKSINRVRSSRRRPGCIRLFVCPTTGGRLEISVSPRETVWGLKTALARKLRISPSKITLIYKEKVLKDGCIQDHHISNESQVTLLPNMETGLNINRSDRSIVQALEKLTETQVNDFLSGRSPLMLAIRMGENMVFVQLQLSMLHAAACAAASNNTTSSHSSVTPTTHSSAGLRLASDRVSRDNQALDHSQQLRANNISSHQQHSNASPINTPTTSCHSHNRCADICGCVTSASDAHQVKQHGCTSSPSQMSNTETSSARTTPVTLKDAATLNEVTRKFTEKLQCLQELNNCSRKHKMSQSTVPQNDQTGAAKRPRTENLAAGPSGMSSVNNVAKHTLTVDSSTLHNVPRRHSISPSVYHQQRDHLQAPRTAFPLPPPPSTEMAAETLAAPAATSSSALLSPPPSPGAIIDTMRNIGRGIYSGTFQGTLDPSLQDGNGRPRRSVSTILHILNDLLVAAPASPQLQQMRPQQPQAQPHSPTTMNHNVTGIMQSPVADLTPPPSPNLVTSNTVNSTTKNYTAPTKQVSSLQQPSQFTTRTGPTSMCDENVKLRNKMQHLQMMLAKRREQKRARREMKSSYVSLGSGEVKTNNNIDQNKKKCITKTHTNNIPTVLISPASPDLQQLKTSNVDFQHIRGVHKCHPNLTQQHRNYHDDQQQQSTSPEATSAACTSGTEAGESCAYCMSTHEHDYLAV